MRIQNQSDAVEYVSVAEILKQNDSPYWEKLEVPENFLS